MKKMFNIKKISLLIIMLFCMFFTMNDVKAEERYECYYTPNSYESAVTAYVKLTYVNGNVKFSYWDYKKDIDVGDWYNLAETEAIYAISSKSGQYIIKDDFKNGCPSEIHEDQIETKTDKGTAPEYLYDIYKGEELEKFKKRATELVCTDKYCGHILYNYYYKNHTIEQSEDGINSENVTCNYFEIIKEDGILNSSKDNDITLTYNKKTNLINVRPPNHVNKDVEIKFSLNDLDGKCPRHLYTNNSDKYVVSLTAKGLPDTIFTYGYLTIEYDDIEDITKESMDVCDGKTMNIISKIYTFIRYLIPIIIIIFSIIDFLGIVISGENEKMEKAKKRFIIRLIAGVAILFIPFILELLFKLAGFIENGENLTDIACNLIK